MDCDSAREKVHDGLIKLLQIKSEDRLADLFTKPLNGCQLQFFYNKLGAYDICAPAQGGLLDNLYFYCIFVCNCVKVLT